MKPTHMPSEETITRLRTTDIMTYVQNDVVKQHYDTKNHWNNEEWFGAITSVSGKGKYRFNQLGTDGFAYSQYRFSNKDDAIQFLCNCQHRLVQVEEGNGQYEVRTYYMDGY